MLEDTRILLHKMVLPYLYISEAMLMILVKGTLPIGFQRRLPTILLQ